MLTIKEFNAAGAAYRRRGCLLYAGVFGTMFLGFGAAFVLGDTVGESRAQLSEVTKTGLVGLALAPAFAVWIGGEWVLARQGRRDGRLVCPHCDKWLWGYQGLVVASRNCTSCGKRVLAEPE